jgi:hypothetical protein
LFSGKTSAISSPSPAPRAIPARWRIRPAPIPRP